MDSRDGILPCQSLKKSSRLNPPLLLAHEPLGRSSGKLPMPSDDLALANARADSLVNCSYMVLDAASGMDRSLASDNDNALRKSEDIKLGSVTLET